jgi:two-component system sensor histidine kinase RegB
LAPVVVSAATLDVASTVFLGGLAFAAISVLAEVHLPLPWSPDNPLRLPALYQAGIWVSLVLGIGFTSMYAWRIASEATRMSRLTAGLALQQRASPGALGRSCGRGRHELGTPLGTIAVVARAERELSTDSHADDFRLLRAGG